ncbi:MAG: nitrite/sulfite reductase, partial [Victivallaceae bacterium]
MSELEHIIQAQQPLLAALQKAENGEITVPDLKPLSGVLGILPQRNNLLATRIRITGGEISTEKFLFLSDLAAKVKPGYIHLSSRQNFQFHDVTPGNAANVITECTANALPFRGGGGDSLRNVAITSSSGIAPDKSADLRPFAEYLTGVIFDWDDAFNLPRKLKIAFASTQDKNLALRQDLGFVETYDNDGRFGFTLYGGGGFGRNAAVAIKLLDFITPDELPRAARAMVELFSEHGDRQNRSNARIRYIAARLGEAEFIKLYLNYYQKLVNSNYPAVPEFKKSWNLRFNTPAAKILISKLEDDSPEYKRWRQFAVSSNRFPGESSVTLFVPGGILQVKAFQKIAKLLKKFNIAGVRLTIEQNIFIPTLPNVLLPDFYAALRKLPVDLTFASFKKQLDCCIGSTVCKAG